MKTKTFIIIAVIFLAWGITSAILTNAGYVLGTILFFGGIGIVFCIGIYAMIRSLLKRKR